MVCAAIFPFPPSPMKPILLLLSLLALPCFAGEAQHFPLWPDGAPQATGATPEHQPTLDFYAPEAAQANGCAVVICPGGGYGGLAKDHEGIQPARFFNSFGVAAYVLHYRLGSNGYRHPIPLHDAQRALRLVRHRAPADGVDPTRIGIMGFSAGGHLAATTGTHHDAGNPAATDPADRPSSRPDFMILCYGVLSFDPAITHSGSVSNLLGERQDDAALRLSLSNEAQVNATTPPTFLFHTSDDQAVPVANSLRFYEALQKQHIPAALHVFQTGRHGIGLAPKDPNLSVWPSLLKGWMEQNQWLKKP